MQSVYMMPTPSQAEVNTTNSINQIVLRLQQTLPEVGWKIVEDLESADIVAAHAGQTSGVHVCDVAHCHGLYPTGTEVVSPKAHWAANRNVIGNLREASEITVPSSWVGKIIRRQFNRIPTVVPWAIQLNEWAIRPHKAFTLWNKTRISSVCDPGPLEYLAQKIPSAQFVSTFINQPIPNIKTTGVVSFDDMKQIIHDCSIYLATTKETFGIGILEAMATGTPILGYRWGAVPSYVDHGVHGFLAEPGDLDSLVDGWHYCMQHRSVLGLNARERAREFTWFDTAARFAEIYSRALIKKQTSRETISVIVPVHNYAHYAPEALLSVLHQETEFEVDLIVINDSSTDDSEAVIKTIHDEWAQRSELNPIISFRIFNVDFQSVAQTRNFGIEHARGQYLLCLDADDRLASSSALQTLATSLEQNECDIAYGRLGTFHDTDSDRLRLDSWPQAFNFSQHFSGMNQVPTCNMFRRRDFDGVGGYRFQYEPSEDADLWTRMIVYGARPKLVSPEILFAYRLHDKSLSADIRLGKTVPVDWLRDHPYRSQKDFPLPTMVNTDDRLSWPVYSYDQPTISIIIPVGEYHKHLWTRALDSVWGQTFKNWRCIVIDDTIDGLDTSQYAWIEVIRGSRKNAAAARNLGISFAATPLITFLDADDYFLPKFLQTLILEISRRPSRYVYSDWISESISGQRERAKAKEYSSIDVFTKSMLHSNNIVIPRVWLDAVGGYNEKYDEWEDIELSMRLAEAGFCGRRVRGELFVYHYQTGKLRERGLQKIDEFKARFQKRFGRYMGVDAEMCQCNESLEVNINSVDLFEAAQSGDMIRSRLIGPTAKVQIVGASGQQYGRRQNGDIFYVWKTDVDASPDRFVPVDQIQTISKNEMPPVPRSVS